MIVLWWGIFDKFDGYATASKDYVRALKRQGVDVIIRGDIQGSVPEDLIENRDKPDPKPGTYTLFIHTFPWIGVIDGQLKTYLKKAKNNIYVTVWEGSEVPWQWIEPFKVVDQIIVPSTFCRDAFRRTMNRFGIVKPLHVIPHVVEALHDSVVTKAITINTPGVNILALAAGTGYRKGFDILLRSFLEEFSPFEKVNLHVKTHDVNILQKYSYILDEYINHPRFIDEDDNLVSPNIFTITGLLTPQEIRALYRQANIFSSLSRGEGFCTLPNAQIKTEVGVKEIKDIKEGDKVFTHRGRLRKVTNTMSRLYSDTLKVIACYGRNNQRLTLTPNHRVRVVRASDLGAKATANVRRKSSYDSVNDTIVYDYNHSKVHGAKYIHRNLEWVEAKDIKPGDFLFYPRLKYNNSIEYIDLADIDSIKNSTSIKAHNKIMSHFDEDNYIPEGKRHSEVYKTDKEFQLLKVKTIEDIQYEGEVYNIGVNEDNSYICENIAVHNCIPLAEAMIEGCRIVYPSGPKTFGPVGSVLWADDFLEDDGKKAFGVASRWDLIDGDEYAGFADQGMLINTEYMYWIESLWYDAKAQLRNAVDTVLLDPRRVIHPKANVVSQSEIGVNLINIIGV